jgi:hypothetical protein
VLWAVSVDGRASNLGEITFEGDRPIPVNLTTPYQTFWLMVTAEPNYAVVDPSTQIVLYSVKGATGDSQALPIKGHLFYFTHYTGYESQPGDALDGIPNQLLQARKAVELASKSGVLAEDRRTSRVKEKEEEYSHEAFAQAKTFLAQSEAAYAKNPRDQAVVQFARTSAQSAENARALATGSVGNLLVRQLESELAGARRELSDLKIAKATVGEPPAPPAKIEPAPVVLPPVAADLPPLVKQPALWFAVAGWAVAVVLLFRRRSI